MNLAIALALVVSIVIILVVLTARSNIPQNEQFDVYNNHTFGAENVYNASLESAKSPKRVDFPDAKRIARYSWSEKDAMGRNVYDRYYEVVNQEKNNGDETPRKTGYVGPYDTKFEIQEFNPPSNVGSYNLKDMYDNDPVYFVFNGEVIDLPQANF